MTLRAAIGSGQYCQPLPVPLLIGRDSRMARLPGVTALSALAGCGSGLPVHGCSHDTIRDVARLAADPRLRAYLWHTKAATRPPDARRPARFQDRSLDRLRLTQVCKLFFKPLLGIVHARLHRIGRDAEQGGNFLIGLFLIKYEPQDFPVLC